MSNFSFSNGVFKRLELQTCKNQGLIGKGLNFVVMLLWIRECRTRNNTGTSMGHNSRWWVWTWEFLSAPYLLNLLFVCLGFYTVSNVFQLFNGHKSQIHVSWTIFNQYLTVYYPDIGGPVIVLFPQFWTPRGKATTTSFKDFGLSRQGIESWPPTQEVD